jgi:hypothetical protein
LKPAEFAVLLLRLLDYSEQEVAYILGCDRNRIRANRCVLRKKLEGWRS